MDIQFVVKSDDEWRTGHGVEFQHVCLLSNQRAMFDPDASVAFLVGFDWKSGRRAKAEVFVRPVNYHVLKNRERTPEQIVQDARDAVQEFLGAAEIRFYEGNVTEWVTCWVNG